MKKRLAIRKTNPDPAKGGKATASEQDLLDAELQRRERERLRDIGRREAARLKRQEERNRWDKELEREAHEVYLKRFPDTWKENRKYRFVPRDDESPEEASFRKTVEKRAFREYQRYRSNLTRDPDVVRYEELEKEATMFLRDRFPAWIMDDAVHEGICKVWPADPKQAKKWANAGRGMKRNAVRWQAYRVWQALSDEMKHRALLIDAARKRGVKLTEEELAARTIKIHSVQKLAIMVEVEHSSEMRRETEAETYDRLLAESDRGRSMETPLDVVMEADLVDVALNDSGLDKHEAKVVKCLRENNMDRKAVQERFGFSKGYISTVLGKAADKIADRLALPRRLCTFGYEKGEKDGEEEQDA